MLVRQWNQLVDLSLCV